MKKYKFVDLKKNGPILEVTLNRPEVYNALHSAAHFELSDIWDDFEKDDDLWVAIITGSGSKAFCSGNDLKATNEGAEMSIPQFGFGGLTSRFNREKPIIAAVNGVAMGGGMEIAIAADIIIAASNAKFALPEVKVGLFAAAGGIQRLSRQIGRKKAMELILTGRPISAQEALELGIINQVSEKSGSDVMDDARTFATALLSSSPTAIRASKRVLNALDISESLDQSIQLSGTVIGDLMNTKDAREGVAAFVEKRAPKWTNS